jgi:hypothetical protein
MFEHPMRAIRFKRKSRTRRASPTSWRNSNSDAKVRADAEVSFSEKKKRKELENARGSRVLTESFEIPVSFVLPLSYFRDIVCTYYYFRLSYV